MQGKAEDAGGLTPAKDDNAAMRALYPRTFAGNSDDCYRRNQYEKNHIRIHVYYSMYRSFCSCRHWSVLWIRKKHFYQQ